MLRKPLTGLNKKKESEMNSLLIPTMIEVAEKAKKMLEGLGRGLVIIKQNDLSCPKALEKVIEKIVEEGEGLSKLLRLKIF
jgi:predicted secreted protein